MEYVSQIANGVFFCDMSDRFSGNVFDGRLRQSTVCAGTGYGTECLFRVYRSSGKGYCCQEALAMVFISGLLFIFVTSMGFRKACIRGIPQPVKSVMSADIGLFLALIGLEHASVVVSNGTTFISMIDFSLWNHTGAIVALAGLVVTGVLFGQAQDFWQVSFSSWIFPACSEMHPVRLKWS